MYIEATATGDGQSSSNQAPFGVPPLRTHDQRLHWLFPIPLLSSAGVNGGWLPPPDDTLPTAESARFTVQVQSLSFAALHPGGQQPSPLMHELIGVPAHVPLLH
jgi:hypothetical protein